MTSNNCAIFKIFLKTEGTTEVRKFVVDDASVITSFVFMKEKLQTLFPKLREGNFRITWRDSEGDDIIIDGDEDLILAFTEMEGPMKTLYVSVVSGSQQQQSFGVPPPFAHPPSRVVCDVCDKEITSFRYKCIQCFDYDLCGACEHAGHHSHHMMLRTSTPELPFSRCGRRIFEHVNKAVKKANHMAYKDCKKKAKWDKKTRHEGCENAGEGEGTSKQDNSQPCLVEQYISQLYPLIDVISNTTTNAASMAANAAANAASAASAAASAGSAPQPSAPAQDPTASHSQSTHLPTDESQATNQFIELVRNALSSVFVQPPHQTPTTKVGTNTETQQFPGAQQKETPVQPSSGQTPMDSEIDLTTSPTLEAMETSTVHREPGWTLLTNEEQVSQPHYPVLQPTINYPPEPQDPVTAVGLQQLVDMGFSDRQALVTLLRRYDGNVAEVIKHIFENK